MPTTAPPRPPRPRRPPRPSDPIDRAELEALVESLIEEARQRARRRRRIVASVVGLVVLLGASTFALFGRPAQSQTPPSVAAQRALAGAGAAGPKIGFVRWTDAGPKELDPGPAELWVMNPDGTGQRLVTRTPGSVWTPDGRRIAFWRNGVLHVMRADGSNERRLGRIRAGWGGPLSPDGRRVAFAEERAGNVDVYVVNADGSGRRRLTTSPAWDVDPTWSPDGRRILFRSGRDGKPETALTARYDGTFELYVVNADGSGERRLTTSRADESWASWSPNGRRIAFVRSGPGCSTSCHRLYVMDADGSRQRRLTRGNDYAPSWSPDGRRIAFVRGWNDVHSHVVAHVYVVGADGSGVRRIPNARSGPEAPAWSPDGSKIAFTRDDGVRNKAFPPEYSFTHNREIYVVNADGSGLRNLTRRPGDDASPVWLRR